VSERVSRFLQHISTIRLYSSIHAGKNRREDKLKIRRIC